jgi:hypothetical protein
VAAGEDAEKVRHGRLHTPRCLRIQCARQAPAGARYAQGAAFTVMPRQLVGEAQSRADVVLATGKQWLSMVAAPFAHHTTVHAMHSSAAADTVHACFACYVLSMVTS